VNENLPESGIDTQAIELQSSGHGHSGGVLTAGDHCLGGHVRSVRFWADEE